MKSVSAREAKTNLAGLLKTVESGEEIVIVKGGRPVARLVRATDCAERPLGFARDLGHFWIAEDFDDHDPEDWRESVE